MKQAVLNNRVKYSIACFFLLFMFLSSILLPTDNAYAWFSLSPTDDSASTHELIGLWALAKVRTQLSNQFLQNYADQIISYTYPLNRDIEAHCGPGCTNAERNGGPIRDWYKNFKAEYEAGAGHENDAARWLGYCLHLIEDMNVPAHAFNIPHAGWLSYSTLGIDNFEQAAFMDPIFTINENIYETTAPTDPAYYYYDMARQSTKQNAASLGYWQEGSGDQWCGSGTVVGTCDDGPAGHYTNGFDQYAFPIKTDQEVRLLETQLNQAVEYVGMFLLGVDRMLSPQPTYDDIYEENDMMNNASYIQVPFWDSTLKCYDDDWFQVWVQTDENIQATIYFTNSAGDLDLYLYDSSGNPLSSSELTNNYETVTYGPSLTNGFYYIKVHGYNGAKNSYSMSVETYTSNSPDLRAKSLGYQSWVVTEGDSFWFSAYVYNSGLTSAATRHARLYLSTNNVFNTAGDYNIGDISVPSVPALTGKWVTWYFNMPNIGSGAYNVWGKVLVDSWNEVAEGYENNLFISTGSNFTAYDSVTLTGLSIIGPTAVNETSSASYTAIASWSNGTTTTVTPTWSENSSYTTITTGGVLSASAVPSNQSVTITASYTYGGVTKTVQKIITVINVTTALTGLEIYGPSSVMENTSAKYVAMATWSDGTTSIASPTWSENSAYTTINSTGLLTAAAISSDQNVTVGASFTYGGVTRTASMTVRIVDVPAQSNQPVRLDHETPVYFSAVQSAYNAADIVDVIQIKAGGLTESLSFNRGIAVFLSGGYDNSFLNSTGTSAIHGTLTIIDGSVMIEYVIIQ